MLKEWDHFQNLRFYSSHKDIVWLQKTWNATGLVRNDFILLVYGQVLQQLTKLICACFILFRSVRVGVGLGAPMKV